MASAQLAVLFTTPQCKNNTHVIMPLDVGQPSEFELLATQLTLRPTVHVTVACLYSCLLYTSPSPRDGLLSRMPSSA